MIPSAIGSLPGVGYTCMEVGASSGVSRGLVAAGNTDNAIRSLFANGVPDAKAVSAAHAQAQVDRQGGKGVFEGSLEFLIANARTPGSEHHVGSRQLLDLANQISLLRATQGAKGPAMDQLTFATQAKVLDKLATAFLAGPGNKTPISGYVAGSNDHEKIAGVKQAINKALGNCAENISAQLFERVSMPIAEANVQGWQNEQGKRLSPEHAFKVATFGKGSDAAMATLGQQLTDGVGKLDSDTLAYLINQSIRQVDLRQGPAAAPELNMPRPGITGAHPNVLASGIPGWPSIVNNNNATGGAVGPITLSMPSDGMRDMMTLMAEIAERNAARLADVNERHNAEVKELYERLLEAKNVGQSSDTPMRSSNDSIVPDRTLEAPVHSASSTTKTADSLTSEPQSPAIDSGADKGEIPVIEESIRSAVPIDARARISSPSVSATGRASIVNGVVSANGSGNSVPDLPTETLTYSREHRPVRRYPEKVVFGANSSNTSDLLKVARSSLTIKLEDLPATAPANNNRPLEQLVEVNEVLGTLSPFRPLAPAEATRELLSQLAGTLLCLPAVQGEVNPVTQLKVQLKARPQAPSDPITLTEKQKLTFDRLVGTDATFAAHYAAVLKHLSAAGHRGYWTQSVEGSNSVLHTFKLGFLQNLPRSRSGMIIATNQGLRNPGILPS